MNFKVIKMQKIMEKDLEKPTMFGFEPKEIEPVDVIVQGYVVIGSTTYAICAFSDGTVKEVNLRYLKAVIEEVSDGPTPTGYVIDHQDMPYKVYEVWGDDHRKVLCMNIHGQLLSVAIDQLTRISKKQYDDLSLIKKQEYDKL